MALFIFPCDRETRLQAKSTIDRSPVIEYVRHVKALTKLVDVFRLVRREKRRHDHAAWHRSGPRLDTRQLTHLPAPLVCIFIWPPFVTRTNWLHCARPISKPRVLTKTAQFVSASRGRERHVWGPLDTSRVTAAHHTQECRMESRAGKFAVYVAGLVSLHQPQSRTVRI